MTLIKNLPLDTQVLGDERIVATDGDESTVNISTQSIADFTEENINPIEDLSFDPLTGVLTIGLRNGIDMMIDLSAYTVLKINGLQVVKGSGNISITSIEDNDKAFGWEGDVFVAFKQVSGVREYAIDNSI